MERKVASPEPKTPLSTDSNKNQKDLPIPSFKFILQPFIKTLINELNLSTKSKYKTLYQSVAEITKLLETDSTPTNNKEVYDKLLFHVFTLYVLSYKINNINIINELISNIQNFLTYKYFIFLSFVSKSSITIEDSIEKNINNLFINSNNNLESSENDITSASSLLNILIKLLTNISITYINNNMIILNIVHIFILLIQLPFNIYNTEQFQLKNVNINLTPILAVINDKNNVNNNVNPNFKIKNDDTIFNYKTTIIHGNDIIRIIYTLYNLYVIYNNNIVTSSSGNNNVVTFNTIYVTLMQIVNYYFTLFNNLYIFYYYIKYYHYNKVYIPKLLEKKNTLLSLHNRLKSDLVCQDNDDNYKLMKSIVYKLISRVVFNMNSEEPGKYGYCIICCKPANHYCIYSYLPICSVDCKLFLVSNYYHAHYTIYHYLNDYPYVFNKFVDQKHYVKPTHLIEPINTNVNHLSMYNNVTLLQQLQRTLNELQFDNSILFKLLCLLSYNNNVSSNLHTNIVVMKQLSLSLIHSIIDQTARYNDSTSISIYTTAFFLNLLRNYLINSLLVNCVSYNESIITISLKIFKLLIIHNIYKNKLRYEIGILLNSLLFSILSSPSITLNIKVIILHFFNSLSLTPNVIIDFFMFYDCNTSNIKSMESPETNVLNENISDSKILGDIKPDSQQVMSSISHGTPLKQSPLIYSRLIELIEKILKESISDSKSSSNTRDTDNLHKIKYYSLSILINIINALISVHENISEKEESQQTDGTMTPVSSKTEIIAPSPAHGLQQNKNETETIEKDKEGVIKKHKAYIENLEKGISKFNINSQDGINYLINESVLKNTPSAIATFLHSTPGLNKTLIGDYLGHHSSFCINVLYAFTNSIDFSNMSFDIALRHFLEYFRLPGEAQKIDRIMEKFADKYCNDNKGVFTSPDIAYVLAYSVIMLNTDAHSPQIKNRMTKQQFINNSKHIYHNNEINEKYLEGIYDRIVENEIILDDNTHRNTTRKSTKRYLEESLMIIKKSKNLLNKLSNLNNNIQNNIIVTSTAISSKGEDEIIINKNKSELLDAISLMINKLWVSTLASFSICFESESDSSLIQLCLNGYNRIIHLLCILNMTTEREIFITALCNMTCLLYSSTSPNSIKEMKEKNIFATKILLKIGEEEGNFLGDSWFHILRCVSEIDRLYNIFLITSSNSTDNANITFHDTIITNAFQVHNFVESQLLDHIFTSSAKLNNDAILYFVKYLCIISKFELNDPNSIYNNVFSLQKIVEITYFNMNRVRIIWRNIWDILSEHFIYAATSPNNKVCAYAIDSLRQLSLKFLEYDELLISHFQYQFLFPFEVILTNYYKNQPEVQNNIGSHDKSHINIPDFIIRCISHLISNRINSIRSGWKCIFNIFAIIASNTNTPDISANYRIATLSVNEQIVQLTFELINNLINNHIYVLSNVLDDVMLCLIIFSHNTFIDISLNSLTALLKFISQLVSTNSSKENKHADIPSQNNKSLIFISANLCTLTQSISTIINNSNNLINLLISNTDDIIPFSSSWILALYSLAYLIDNDNRLEIRIRSSQILFNILMQNGNFFNSKHPQTISFYWRIIFEEILFPLFFRHHHFIYYFTTLFNNHYINDLILFNPNFLSQSGDTAYNRALIFNQEWVKTTSFTALSTLIELYIHYYRESHLIHILNSLCSILTLTVTHNHNFTIPLLKNEVNSTDNYPNFILLLLFYHMHLNVKNSDNFFPSFNFTCDDSDEDEELCSIGYKCFHHLINALLPLFNEPSKMNLSAELDSENNEMTCVLMSLLVIMTIELPYELLNLDINFSAHLFDNNSILHELFSCIHDHSNFISGMEMENLFEKISSFFSRFPLNSFSLLDSSTISHVSIPQVSHSPEKSYFKTYLEHISNESQKPLSSQNDKPELSKQPESELSDSQKSRGVSLSDVTTPISSGNRIREHASEKFTVPKSLEIPNLLVSSSNLNSFSSLGISPFTTPLSSTTHSFNYSLPQSAKSVPNTKFQDSKPSERKSSYFMSSTTSRDNTPKKEHNISPLSEIFPITTLPPNCRSIINKCKMQHLIMNLLKTIISADNGYNFLSFQLSHHQLLIFMLYRSFNIAKLFNNNIILRLSLYQSGFLKDKQLSLPELFYQEIHSSFLLYSLLLSMYTRSNNTQTKEYAEKFLLPFIEHHFIEYYNKDHFLFHITHNNTAQKGANENKDNLLQLLILHDLSSELTSKVPLIEYIVNSLSTSFDKELLDKLYSHLCNLIEVNSLPIRRAVNRVMKIIYSKL